MGGYGALRNGLRYADTFGAIAALSPVPLMQQVADAREDTPFPFGRPSFLKQAVGELTGIENTDANPVWLAQRAQELPRIFCACGASDSLRPGIVAMCQDLECVGAELCYEEHEGGHDWEFWTWGLRRTLDWLPLDNTAAGINSGNVGL